MRKLLIICYYELKDYLLSIAETFIKKYKWVVVHYPLYMYCYDRFSKIDNYDDHLSEYMTKEKPDLVLWWFNDVPLQLFHRIKNENPNTFFTIYNYSDPLSFNKTYIERCSIFDQVITVCQQSMPLYKVHSKTKYVDFFPMGYDKNIFRQHTIKEINDFDSKYKCDISLVCDSMYLDQKDQEIDRKSLIERLNKFCTDNKLSFNIYGPDMIQPYAGRNYKGDLKYVDSPANILLSKINIITHPDNRKKLGLCNMNLFPIIACGGIVLMDDINGSELFFNNKHRTVNIFNKNNLESRIREILNRYEMTPENILQQRLNAINYAKGYSWDDFAEKIYMRYILDKFNYPFYSRVYNLDSSLSQIELFKKWHEMHMNGDIQIPYEFIVPENFDIENYRSKFGMKKESHEDEYIYIHWYMNGKNADYIKRIGGKNTAISGLPYNMTTTKLFDLFTGFNSLYIYRDLDSGFDTLHKIAKQNPRLQINDALNKYIDITYNE